MSTLDHGRSRDRNSRAALRAGQTAAGGPLGSAADWHLTEHTFAALRDELTDHLDCLQGEEGSAAARQAEQRLGEPATRRRLTGPHVADQVRATLHRWPTRHEWRELLWLLVWFVLILLADALAVQANAFVRTWLQLHGVNYFRPDAPDALLQGYNVAAWLLQGIARAGFYATFGVSLWRAWRSGTGVFIARVLQLKLIHTVLVISAGLVFGDTLMHSAWFWRSGGAYSYVLDLPVWFNAALVSGALLAVALGLLFVRRLRIAALGTALTALFLFPAGPIPSQQVTTEWPFVRGTLLELSDGSLAAKNQFLARSARNRDLTIVGEHAPTPELLRRYAEETRQLHRDIDFERNVFQVEQRVISDSVFWHVQTGPGRASASIFAPEELLASGTMVARRGPMRLEGPVSIPGAGLGWLAAPIPLLGFVGLAGMLLVLGRRGVADMLLYGLLALTALIATVMPFVVVFGSHLPMLDLGPRGIVGGPFPGFELLLMVPSSAFTSNDMGDGLFSIMLLTGLLLSAGVPWLLTSLFLKPGAPRGAPPQSETA